MDRFISVVLICMIIAGISYYFWQESLSGGQDTVKEGIELLEPPVRPEPEEKEIRFPVPVSASPAIVDNGPTEDPAPVSEIVLPDLEESDSVIRQELIDIDSLFGMAAVFIFNDFIRRVVVTVDNLTARKIPQRFIFTTRPEGGFAVRKTDKEDVYLSSGDNYPRYKKYLDLAERLPDAMLVALYVRYYPLFQQAYEDLGYPDRYFNDRLVAVIDHLLLTPEVKDELLLKQPKVYYEYLDPDLEKLSSGQKILLRIGSENRLNVKRRLNNIRHLLVSLPTQ